MFTLRLLVPTVLVFLSPAVLSQKASRVAPGPFVVADIFAEPDELLMVRTSGAGTTSQGTHLLGTPVNFLRGVVLDGPDSGWFVSGYSETGGPTGFYRFANGQSTLVAPFPLTRWGSLADTSWSRNGDFIWYVWDPSGPQKETLYTIDLAGAFTQVGEIRYANGVALGIAGGIALDRRTGVLYSYDQTTASLITIDPVTAVATRVGPSGLRPYSQIVIMSMDFSNDGRLFMIRNFGNLYEVNLSSGAAVSAGAVSTACASLAFVPPTPVVR